MANICLNCGCKFYIKRNILELFSTKKEYLCMACYKKYPLNIKFEDIILDNYEVRIVSMFNELKVKDLNYYINEYDKIYKSLLKTTNLPIIFVDEIILNDDTFEELDAMTKLFKSNLIILTFVKR